MNKSPKILLAEDAEVAQNAAQMFLQAYNCSVDIADTGLSAISHSKQSLYDLILLDIGLPDIDGLDVAQQVRLPENPNKDTPIVALTAYDAQSYRHKVKEAGINDYIAKPLSGEMTKYILTKYRLI